MVLVRLLLGFATQHAVSLPLDTRLLRDCVVQDSQSFFWQRSRTNCSTATANATTDCAMLMTFLRDDDRPARKRLPAEFVWLKYFRLSVELIKLRAVLTFKTVDWTLESVLDNNKKSL